MNWKDLTKYFIHGIAFSILYLLLVVAWALILTILVGIGSFIGLIIGIVILLTAVGFINSVLGVQLWDIDAGGKGFLSMLFHGLVLFIILLVVGFAVSFPLHLILPEFPAQIIAFIIQAFLYGLIGRTVCSWFG